MSRFPQRIGERGSLKWIQRAVNAYPHCLNELILPSLPGATSISWRSPLACDEFAEYRDAAFLQRICASELTTELERFWPNRGPQWDALARSDAGDILLVEAKAHIGELCSPASQAGPASQQRINAALDEVIRDLRAVPLVPWSNAFYQLANRLAHVHFLRKHGRNAWLVLVNFLNDENMCGPRTPGEWDAAYQIVWHVMGLPKRHRLTRFIIAVHPSVAQLSGPDC